MSSTVSNHPIRAGAATVPDGARAAAEASTRKEKSTWHLDEHDKIYRVKEGITRCYTIDQKIGSGAFSNVWTIIGMGDKSGKTKIAKIAVYYDHNNFPNEYRFSLRYPKKSVGLSFKTKAYLDNGKDKKILIMHKYDGDISSIISSMTKKEKIEAICQIAKGLATLHDSGIIHGDGGFPNIFYDREKKRYDLGDFGFSRDLKDENSEDGFSRKLDIRHFKGAVKSILIGEDNGRRRRMGLDEHVLNTKEAVLRLGYSEEVSTLIIDFLNNTPDDMQKVSEIFDNVRKAFVGS